MGLNLAVSHITKSYGGRDVLSDCSFSFSRTGTYVLMGPNGSGKSTLLRICALLEEPDSGAVSYFSGDGPLVHDISLKRRITLVLPRVGIFNTSVFKNAAYGLTLRGAEKHDLENRVMKMLSFAGLEKKRDQQALTLSSGETQRLGLARALVLDPEILFLDEPTASIDQENTEIVENIILTMKKEGGTTVIMTTHDQAQAERLADELLFLNRGRIERKA
jgi:tungstate transport system ATP-binding protein